MKRAIQENVVRRLDHRHLNFDVDFLRGVNPTAENIAVGIWGQLESRVAPGRLVRVTLDETEKNRVVYEGGSVMSSAPTQRRLTRSSRHKMIAGVCGGLAEYFQLDPTVVRVAYVLISIVSVAFPGILAYIILMFVMPPPDQTPLAP